MTAIHLIIGTLQRMHVFGVENRDTLTHKATGVTMPVHHVFLFQLILLKTLHNAFPCEQYSAKLLKKPDQCRAVYACAHLFWVDDSDSIKDGERYLPTHYGFHINLQHMRQVSVVGMKQPTRERHKQEIEEKLFFPQIFWK